MLMAKSRKLTLVALLLMGYFFKALIGYTFNEDSNLKLNLFCDVCFIICVMLICQNDGTSSSHKRSGNTSRTNNHMVKKRRSNLQYRLIAIKSYEKLVEEKKYLKQWQGGFFNSIAWVFPASRGSSDCGEYCKQMGCFTV